MFCDVTDPTLRRILFPSDPPPAGFLREECDILTDGWFGNGTLAKTKTIMRAKVLALLDDKMLDDEVEFANIVKLPDHATPESVMVDFWLDPAVASQREMMLATEVRGIIKGAPAWKERVGGAAAGKKGVVGREEVGEEGDRKGKKRADRRVQFQDEVGGDGDGDGGGEMLSEGEEEAFEQEELAEAVAEAAAASGGGEDDVDEDVDEDEEQSDEDDGGEDEDTEMGGVGTPRATRRRA